MTKNPAPLILAIASMLPFGLIASAEPAPGRLPFGPASLLMQYSTDDIQRVDLGGGVYVDRLSGLTAYAHLQNLRSRQPEAFEAATRALREKGFHPTSHVYVERTVRLASSPNFGSTAFAQDYSESNSEGEILFWSWSDGDDNTWEGQIYVEIYANGDASTWEGQIDASNEDHEWIYNQQTWEDPEVQNKEVTDRRQHFRALPDQVRTHAIPAVLSSQTRGYLGHYATAGWMEWARCWRQNVVAFCTGAAIGCLASNGGWPACWGATCVGVEVASAIACY